MLDPSETIVAIASARGAGPRGLIRLSGPDAVKIALGEFEADEPGPPPTRPSALLGRLDLRDCSIRFPATIVVWPGLRSYTGQPSAEIHTVGSPPILDRIVAGCLARGARRAEPGEFTLRAFLSGRIDLTQAEAVLEVIEAGTPARLDAALRQLAGGLTGPLRDLRDRLLDRLVELEANLDFVDESDVSPIHRQALVKDLVDAVERLEELSARRRSRDRVEMHPRAVLVGPPNAGKSRLFNALIGRDGAIVSPVAGTTRDYLIGLGDCDGLTVEFVDTAGEEFAETPIESASQSHREDQSNRADLVLVCRPADADKKPNDRSTSDRRLLVLTKADLLPNRDRLPLAIATSAATGEGLPELRSAIASALRSRAEESTALVGLGSQCRESIDHATESLRNAVGVAAEPGGEELIAAEIRHVVDELGKLVGAVVTEDILDRIFRRFCIGK